jgi:hypothetical protein
VNTRLGSILVAGCTLFLALTSCAESKPARTDDDLIAIFRQNSATFDNLVARSLSSPPNCEAKDPNICEPVGANDVQADVSHQLGLQVEAVYIKRNLSNSLWVPVESYGYWGMSSSSRGYVYCRCSLGPQTKDTLEAIGQGTNGTWYRQIEDGWMLFAAR